MIGQSPIPSFSDTMAAAARSGVLSRDPIQWNGLRGWWQPSAGIQGARLFDLTGNGNHATLTDFDLSAAWATSIRGPALETSASSTINIGLADVLNLSSLTVTAWVRLTLSGTNQPLIGWGAIAGRDEYPGIDCKVIPVTGTAGPTIWLGETNRRLFEPGDLDDGNWHHVAFIIPGSAQTDIESSQFFLDGQEKAALSTLSLGPQQSKTDLQIGVAGGIHFRGGLDDVRIYAGILPVSMIQRIYAEGVLATRPDVNLSHWMRRHIVTRAVLYAILVAIRDKIRAMHLAQIDEENIILAKVLNERETVLPGLPGIMIVPLGQEFIQIREGTVARDDVGYPVAVMIMDQDRQDTGTGEPAAAVSGTQDQEFRLQSKLLWREQIRGRFNNQRLQLSGAEPDAHRVVVDPLEVVKEDDWLVTNIWISGLLFRVWVRQSRLES